MDPGASGIPSRAIGALSAPPALRDAAVALLAVGLAASLVSWWADLGAPYLVKAVIVAMACTGMGWLVSRRIAGVTRFSIADRVTLTRAALVVLVMAVIGEAANPALAALTLAIAGVAAALDAVDGLIARRIGQVSAFGARFDMETDAVLILALSVLAWTWDKAGAWILLAGLARYLFVAGASVAPFLTRDLPPSRRRQAVCVVQVVTLLVCISPWVPPPASALVAGAGLVALIYSFSVDVYWLRQHARSQPPPGEPS